MAITLSPEIEKMVNEHIQNGGYSSADEVLRDAMNILSEVDERERRETQAAIERAIEQSRRGEGRPAEQVLDEMRAKYGIPR
jgi:putative addiction module CopG family antidote